MFSWIRQKRNQTISSHSFLREIHQKEILIRDTRDRSDREAHIHIFGKF